MRRQLSLGRPLAAAALVAAAAGVGLVSPAHAAGCPSADGVTVVVDFNELGGGVPSVCDSDGGGKKASVLFPDAGFPLSYASRQPGFVCRVAGAPASDPCVNTAPANAYWGLWWSDGKSGSWNYSSLGAASLSIPDGGYVAFSWDQSDGSTPPSFTPAVHRSEPAPDPTPSPTPSPTSRPSPTSKPSPTQPGPGASATPSPDAPPTASEPAVPTATSGTSAPPSPGPTSASPSASKSKTASASESSTPGSASSSDVLDDEALPAAGPGPDAVEPEGDGLPPFVAPALIGTLFAVAGVVFLVRRRPGSP